MGGEEFPGEGHPVTSPRTIRATSLTVASYITKGCQTGEAQPPAKVMLAIRISEPTGDMREFYVNGLEPTGDQTRHPQRCSHCRDQVC